MERWESCLTFNVLMALAKKNKAFKDKFLLKIVDSPRRERQRDRLKFDTEAYADLCSLAEKEFAVLKEKHKWSIHF
jgi:hypothetical protein